VPLTVAEDLIPGSQGETRATIKMRRVLGVSCLRSGFALPRQPTYFFPGYPQGAGCCLAAEAVGRGIRFFRDKKIGCLPGQHVTDCQTRLFVKSRATAAAWAPIGMIDVAPLCVTR